jgi:alkylhydroperoxidase family enzyme
MARVRLLDEAAGAAVRGTMGPEARRALAHRPAMADAIGLYNEAVADSRLDPRLHELVRYRIAEINDCFR